MPDKTDIKRIALLGSTGSIGRQTLQVVDSNPEYLKIKVLTAFNNAELLVKQALKYLPDLVVIGNDKKYKTVREALRNSPVNVMAGLDAISDLMEMDSFDIVLTAMVGFSGLIPTIRAVKKRKTVALANKETMVVAGELVRKLASDEGVTIIPVDSEHSAIFQCLAGEEHNLIEKLILTASGGPFRDKDMEYIKNVTVKQALNHPNWSMGRKITIDSASMMNKGLEVIEARWLFNVPPEKIEVVIHHQSIIHSIVQFEDGSMKAQMGMPDMRLPIQYALTYPFRMKSDFPRLSFTDYLNLSFEPPDIKKFRNLAISYEVLQKGGNFPCIMNAANEVAVNAFLSGRISFIRIPEIIENVLDKSTYIGNPSLEDYQNSDKEARMMATQLIN